MLKLFKIKENLDNMHKIEFNSSLITFIQAI